MRSMRPIWIACSIPLVLGVNILRSNSFSTCSTKSDITVQRLNIEFFKDNRALIFDIAGTSNKIQNVTALLTVSAYGQQVYSKTFDPCDDTRKVQQLCPLSSGAFSAAGSQQIPTSITKFIPSIAFAIPDLDGSAKLVFQSGGTGEEVACIQSQVSNGKTISLPIVQYIAVAIVGAALSISAITTLVEGQDQSPTFAETIWWFQSLAMNGMLSVNYPPIYRSFSKNFAFSCLLIPSIMLQRIIDRFRLLTGGTLTKQNTDNVDDGNFLYQPIVNRIKKIIYQLPQPDSSSSTGTIHQPLRSVSRLESEILNTPQFTQGIADYTRSLQIPSSNIFMTVFLLFIAIIVIIAIVFSLVKVILETFRLIIRLPKSLERYRRQYWWIVGNTMSNLMLLMLTIGSLCCVHQFVADGPWTIDVFAGLTLGMSLIIPGWFSWRVWSLFRNSRQQKVGSSALYDDEEIWQRYGFLYDAYKQQYLWTFVPIALYMLSKGTIIAAADGHGLVQVIGLLVCETLLLFLLLIIRPFASRSGNFINITIQIFRLVSILCFLVFLDQFAITQTAKALIGILLVVIETVLTGALALLIMIKGLLSIFRPKPRVRLQNYSDSDTASLEALDMRDLRLTETALRLRSENYRTQGEHWHSRRMVSDIPTLLEPLLPHVSLPPENGLYRYRGFSPF